MQKKIAQVITIILVVILLLVGVLISKNYSLPQYNGQQVTESDWVLQIDDGEKRTVNLPSSFEYSGKKTYRLSTTLHYNPGELESPYAFVDVNHMYIKAYLDGKLIYEFTENENRDLSKSPGNAYITMPLPQDCYGKTFTLELEPTLEHGIVYSVGAPTFADYATFMHKTFFDWLPQNIMSVVSILLGILLLVLNVLVEGTVMLKKIWYVGLFAVLFGIYSLSENQFNVYILGNTYLIYLVNFIAFAAFPLPIFAYFRDTANEKFWKIYNIILALGSANIFIQIGLHFTGIRDLREMLIFTHIMAGIMVVTIAATMIMSRGNKSRDKLHLLQSIVPVFIGGILDGVAFYGDFLTTRSNTQFTQLGVLIFLSILAIWLIRSVMDTYRDRLRSDFYKSLAFKDGLTGVGNRAAYNEEIKRIDVNRQKYMKVICISADINGLKQINDGQGHMAGDEVICRLSGHLSRFFANIGRVFRVGGDEFVTMVYDKTTDQIEEILRLMKKEIMEENQMKKVKLQYSIGSDQLKKEDDTVEQSLRRSDVKMYEDKSEQKKHLN